MPSTRRLGAHEKRVVAAAAGWRCAACGDLLDSTYEVDHILPLHRGGEDDVGNMQPLHKACHAKKTQREEIERLRMRSDSAARHTRGMLTCSVCQHIVSPYFVHVCRGPKS